MAGLQDRKEGFRYDDDRGSKGLDIEVQGFYRQGYRRGYYHEDRLRELERREKASSPAAGLESGPVGSPVSGRLEKQD